eukprot:scaffold3582_cov32-Tisochrysis_lutea.AAC.3
MAHTKEAHIRGEKRRETRGMDLGSNHNQINNKPTPADPSKRILRFSGHSHSHGSAGDDVRFIEQRGLCTCVLAHVHMRPLR